MKRIKFLPVLAMMIITPLAAHAVSPAEKKEFEELVHDYIMDNPEIILKAVEKHRMKEEQRAEEEALKLIKESGSELTSKSLPSIGNLDADVTVIEFFDYNCGYCKRALPDIIALTEKDPNVRVVFHELPILSETSFTAAQWALAAHEQGKYFEFHSALMKHSGSKNEAEMEKIAKNLGLDLAKMKKDSGSLLIKNKLEKTAQLSQKMGIQGTPAFIVGSQIFRGYVGHDGLSAAVAQERQKAKEPKS